MRSSYRHAWSFFLLQQRDNVPGTVHPGKIGLFGGHRECGETYLQCIVREVHEELSYFIPPERFESATNGQSLHTRRHWFEAKIPLSALVLGLGRRTAPLPRRLLRTV